MCHIWPVKMIPWSKTILLLFSFCIVSSSSAESCFSSLTQQDCAAGQVLTSQTDFCPTCTGGGGLRDLCTVNPCAPGLACPGNRCDYAKPDNCWFTRHVPSIVTLRPTCTLNGKYAAVQCKGDRVTGRCFCSSEDGEKIFGWEWWKNAAKMTCACSRWRHKLEQSGRVDAFMHCEANGNYESLQCTTKVCWCADPETGRLQNGTTIVPASWWTRLPCCKSDKREVS